MMHYEFVFVSESIYDQLSSKAGVVVVVLFSMPSETCALRNAFPLNLYDLVGFY